MDVVIIVLLLIFQSMNLLINLAIILSINLSIQFISRQNAKHMWTELVEHQMTQKLVDKYADQTQIRNIQKVLDSLRP